MVLSLRGMKRTLGSEKRDPLLLLRRETSTGYHPFSSFLYPLHLTLNLLVTITLNLLVTLTLTLTSRIFNSPNLTKGHCN